MQLAMKVNGTFLTQTRNTEKESQITKVTNTSRTSQKMDDDLESDYRSSAMTNQPRKVFNHQDHLMRHAADQQEEIYKQMFKNDKDREISELPALKNQAERLALKMGFDKDEYISKISKIQEEARRFEERLKLEKRQRQAEAEAQVSDDKMQLCGINMRRKIKQHSRIHSNQLNFENSLLTSGRHGLKEYHEQPELKTYRVKNQSKRLQVQEGYKAQSGKNTPMRQSIEKEKFVPDESLLSVEYRKQQGRFAKSGIFASSIQKDSVDQH